MEKYIPKVGDKFTRPPMMEICTCEKVDDYYVYYKYQEEGEIFAINKLSEFKRFDSKEFGYIPSIGDFFVARTNHYKWIGVEKCALVTDKFLITNPDEYGVGKCFYFYSTNEFVKVK